MRIAQTCLHDLGADKMTAEKLRIDEYFEQMTCKLSGKQMSNMADILFEKSLSKNENDN